MLKKELISIWKEMQHKAFLSHQINKDLFNKNLDAFKTASIETIQRYLIEVLINSYVNLSEIEDESYRISNEEIELNYFL